MGLLDALYRELYDARKQARPLAHIRITRDALPGVIVSTPITPERARLLHARLVAFGAADAVVVADPTTERLLELPIHPDDWAALLCEVRPWAFGMPATPDGEPETVPSVYDEPVSVCGVPVLRF